MSTSVPKPAPRSRGGSAPNFTLSAINDQVIDGQLEQQAAPVPRPRYRSSDAVLDDQDLHADSPSANPPKVSPIKSKKVSFGEIIPIETITRPTTSPVSTRGLNTQDLAQRERAVSEKEIELRRWEERLRAEQSDNEFAFKEKERELQYREDQVHMKEKELKHKQFDMQMDGPSNDGGNTSERLANLASRELELDKRDKTLHDKERYLSNWEGQLLERERSGAADTRGYYGFSPHVQPPQGNYTQPQPVMYQQYPPQPGQSTQAATTQHPLLYNPPQQYLPHQGQYPTAQPQVVAAGQYPTTQPQVVAGGQYPTAKPPTSPQAYVQPSPEPSRSPVFQPAFPNQQIPDQSLPPKPSELPAPIYTPPKTVFSVDEELALALQNKEAETSQSQIVKDAIIARALQEQDVREVNYNLDMDQLIALSIQDDLLKKDDELPVGGGGAMDDIDTSAQEAIQRRLQERLKEVQEREEIDRRLAEQLSQEAAEQQPQQVVPGRNDLDV